MINLLLYPLRDDQIFYLSLLTHSKSFQNQLIMVEQIDTKSK